MQVVTGRNSAMELESGDAESLRPCGRCERSLPSGAHDRAVTGVRAALCDSAATAADRVLENRLSHLLRFLDIGAFQRGETPEKAFNWLPLMVFDELCQRGGVQVCLFNQGLELCGHPLTPMKVEAYTRGA